jgi:hypothetical protein
MKIRYVLATLLALFALLTLLDRFVLLEMLVLRIAVPLLLAAIAALAAMATGALVRRTRRVDVALDLLIGYPVFGTLAFLVASVHVSMATMLPLLIAGAIGGGWLLLARYADHERAVVERVPLSWPAIAVATVIACGFVAAQAPPSSLDELAYHLAIPQTWMLEGRAIELPLNSHSYFPLGIESADLTLLAVAGPIDGGIAVHLLHLFAAVATTALILRRTSSWLATAAIVTTPALAVTAGWAVLEWPLVGLFVALWTLLESDDVKGASAATAAGLLTKYTFAPFALLAWVVKRRVPHWTALLGFVFYARNLLLTLNPFAPFFTQDAPHVAGFRALALADYVFEGTFLDEALGASILVLPVFAVGTIAAGSALLALLLFFLAPSSRILVPFLAVGAASAAPVLKRRSIAIVTAIAVVIQTFLVVLLTARAGSFSMMAGAAAEDEYLRKQRPAQTEVEWLNAALPQTSRTLLVGLNETYWFSHRVRGGGNFDGPRVSRYLDMPTPEALRERLRADGITHVAVVTAPLRTTVEEKRQERETRLSVGAQKMLALTLDRYASNVTSHGNATLFTLR